MTEVSPNVVTIMIVDDNPVNLKMLAEMLGRDAYQVLSFPLGRLALAAVQRNPPDLILLDVNMPEMNGYEVCARLKAEPKSTSIPVIFLSALDGTEDKVKAFQSGASDYISKPFQLEEVQARVRTHLSLHQLQRALTNQNLQLADAVAARTRELADANTRLQILDKSKSEFLSLISHEFRTPLHGILGIGELLLDECATSDRGRNLQTVFDRNRRRLLSIMDDALLLTEIDINGPGFKIGPVDLGRCLAEAFKSASGFAESRKVELSPTPADAGFVMGKTELLSRALASLIETAVKFSLEGETVTTNINFASGWRIVTLEAVGRTVPPDTIARFFEIMAIAQPITPGGDLGLGPAAANRLLALFGGSVRVENTDRPGVRFEISLSDVLGR